MLDSASLGLLLIRVCVRFESGSLAVVPAAVDAKATWNVIAAPDVRRFESG